MAGANGDHKRTDYEEKFAEFIIMLAEIEVDTVMISHPEVLGDTYEEIVESLNRLSDADKKLVIVPKRER